MVELHFSPQFTRFDNAAADYIHDPGEVVNENYASAMSGGGLPPAATDDDTPF